MFDFCEANVESLIVDYWGKYRLGIVGSGHTLLTYNPEINRLYVYLLDYPLGRLLLKGYAGKVRYAQFLHDRSELWFGKANASVTHKDELDEKDILLVLPDVRPDVEIPVIELILN